MKKVINKIAHRDKRGVIIDLLEKNMDKICWDRFLLNKNSIRRNGMTVE